MPAKFSPSVALLVFLSWMVAMAPVAAQSGGDFSDNAQAKKLPTDTILVKGAWASATDSKTPIPEGGEVTNRIYSNPYFALTFTLPADWIERYTGPPPSDSGYYVLSQIRPAETDQIRSRGSLLIAAQDLFFSLTPASNALEWINLSKDGLSADYKVEQTPTLVRIGNNSFVRFDYASPAAELHWHVLATQIRCHMVQFVFTGHDPSQVETLIQNLERMTLPDEAGPISGKGGGSAPVCIKDYARDENILEKLDPVFTERRFNPVPVRIIIDKDGKVKHIHFLSAFPDQAKAITDTLFQWRFRPYIVDGKPVEVETGIMFGHAPRPPASVATGAVSE
jgi:hypothetical protein